METTSSNALQQFNNYVAIRFQLYNSLFTSLPFHKIERTGILLSLFLLQCEEGYEKKKSPRQIIDQFFKDHTTYTNEQEKIDLLFRFVQYAERQVVLFDALEDAAFTDVINVNGEGSMSDMISIIKNKKNNAQAKKLKDFSFRMVLTAHPTQFYPGEVLGIIYDLSNALKGSDTGKVNLYLQQLGKTPFLKKEKPTPYDEACSLIWYLENVLYHASGRIIGALRSQLGNKINQQPLELGFWPGGDRDGNPNVTAPTTLKVADALRSTVVKCYYLDVRKLKRRLTFKGVSEIIKELEVELYHHLFLPADDHSLKSEWMLEKLNSIKDIIIKDHNGLFLQLVENLIGKVQVFGLYFASLDIRQESTVHNKVLEEIAAKTNALPENYSELNEKEKLNLLFNITETVSSDRLEKPLYKDTLDSVYAVKSIQEKNGEKGCNRYIISQTKSALNIIEVYGLFLLCGWKKEELNIDIIPLFETIDDLQHGSAIMKALYADEYYKAHLQIRGNKQTIMVGFSDGTKDGGYLMANWGIYHAKKELIEISKQSGIEVTFFDGRGGPPARGGGKTNKFYSSMGRDIAGKAIQLTIQGQTVSSNFGTIDSARFNMEQLMHAGMMNELGLNGEQTFTPEQEDLFQTMAQAGFKLYNELKHHPEFMEYMSQLTPLPYFAETNISSRPSKRGKSSSLTLNDLRAIPYVGSWTLIKQNVTGYYGVGTALAEIEMSGRWNEVQQLYDNSPFFKTLIDNCEMVMMKTYFPLTEYLKDDAQFGELWNLMHTEFELAKKYVLKLSGSKELMEDYPVEKASIQMRERIVLPLVSIQQYALAQIREAVNEETNNKEVFEKMVIRSSFGIINAGRNSV
ncbi:MAG: Phosphoenolpyruvate carboxylase, type 1 [Chitinophagaceae bacterium]|nr:Phosphoenolpyruvate carboxylase, type 1 [Chitinophagaceae bacterium]